MRRLIRFLTPRDGWRDAGIALLICTAFGLVVGGVILGVFEVLRWWLGDFTKALMALRLLLLVLLGVLWAVDRWRAEEGA